MSQEILEKVCSIVSEQLSVEAGEVKSDSNFQNDLGADSLDTVELVMALEEAFDIEIPDEAAEGIATVGDAVKFIEEKKVIKNAKFPSSSYYWYGAVTPIGNNIDEYLVGLQTGTNGVSEITLFDPVDHPCKFAAEVKNLQSESFIEPKESKRWDRFSQFGVIAAKQAFKDSGLQITEANASRIGVIIGSGVGGLLTMESQAQILSHKGPKRVSPFTVPMMIPNMATGLAAIALGAKDQVPLFHRLRCRFKCNW